MRIRPYIESRDYDYLKEWIDDERTHTLWCANQISYPVTKEDLHDLLEKNAEDWTDSAYVATEDDGEVVGFFCYCVNVADNTGFLKFIVVDNKKRGAGYGRRMLQLALRYAFDITGVKSVSLNVFDENARATQCYEKLGFTTESISKEKFAYKDELWGRRRMTISAGCRPDNCL